MKNLKDNPDAGFSLLEVVVALLMIFFFTTGALEMFVLSSIFKKKAIQYTTAINLIQQDMEKIKSAADQYSFPTVTTVATAGATTVALSSTNGFPTHTLIKLYFLTIPIGKRSILLVVEETRGEYGCPLQCFKTKLRSSTRSYR